MLLRTCLGAPVSPTPSAGSRRSGPTGPGPLLPLVEDTGWFFDTELLFLAERAGLRIHEVPVDWVDDPDSRVDIVAHRARATSRAWPGSSGRLATGTFRWRRSGNRLGRTGREPPPRLFAQLARFAAIGVVSTVAYVLLYVVLRTGMPARGRQCAGAAGDRGRQHGGEPPPDLRDPRPGPISATSSRASSSSRSGSALTSGALVRCTTWHPRAGRGLEVGVLVTAGIVATAVRFVLFRSWVFPEHPGDTVPNSHLPHHRPSRHPCRGAPDDDRRPFVRTCHRSPPDGLGQVEKPEAPHGASIIHRLWRGRPATRPGSGPRCSTLLAATAVLYLWGLGASRLGQLLLLGRGRRPGPRAGRPSSSARSTPSTSSPSTSRRPSLWVMEISARIFGVNSWSILVPQALEGVAAVGVLYATVRRWFRPGAGLLAGPVLALTPVAALMFRFNNPDALLVLLLTVAAYATVRALEAGRTRWLVLAGALVGFGFLTKMLQAFLVVPAFGLVYLIAAPTPLRRRIGQLAGRRRGAGGRRRVVGRDRGAHPGRETAPTSAARRTTAS